MNKVLIFLLFGFLLSSCSKDSSFVSDSLSFDDSMDKSSELKAPATHCETGVYDFVSGEELDGTTTLLRTNNKISMTLRVGGLTPGNAYTIWWVVWNNPENCKTPFVCIESDFDNFESVGVDVLYAAGHIAGASGKGNFAGSLSEGDTSGSVFTEIGVQDARTAEVHLVLRDHGTAIPGEIPAQIGTFPGGCDTNVCSDLMFAIFSPDCGQ